MYLCCKNQVFFFYFSIFIPEKLWIYIFKIHVHVHLFDTIILEILDHLSIDLNENIIVILEILEKVCIHTFITLLHCSAIFLLLTLRHTCCNLNDKE